VVKGGSVGSQKYRSASSCGSDSAVASAAPSVELLALAQAEGFGRSAAADVATRIADAFGVPAGALEPADCADLLLQALTS
jgi:hypothetical protein